MVTRMTLAAILCYVIINNLFLYLSLEFLCLIDQVSQHSNLNLNACALSYTCSTFVG